MLDPQVQIRIIELAWQWADKLTAPPGSDYIEAKTKYFDRVYKAILKTVQPENEPK